MRLLEYFHKGVIEDLYKKGVVSWQVYSRFDIYNTYSNYLIENDYIEARKLTADDFGISVKTVKRAISMMES